VPEWFKRAQRDWAQYRAAVDALLVESSRTPSSGPQRGPLVGPGQRRVSYLETARRGLASAARSVDETGRAAAARKSGLCAQQATLRRKLQSLESAPPSSHGVFALAMRQTIAQLQRQLSAIDLELAQLPNLPSLLRAERDAFTALDARVARAISTLQAQLR
jgi:hypothetical protein